jgi:hypothetical protein
MSKLHRTAGPRLPAHFGRALRRYASPGRHVVHCHQSQPGSGGPVVSSGRRSGAGIPGSPKAHISALPRQGGPAPLCWRSDTYGSPCSIFQFGAMLGPLATFHCVRWPRAALSPRRRQAAWSNTSCMVEVEPDQDQPIDVPEPHSRPGLAA